MSGDKSKEKQSALNAESNKRQKKNDNESIGVEASSSENDQHPDDVDLSSVESTSESIESSSLSQDEQQVDRIAEVVLDFEIKFDEPKSERKEQVKEVLKAEIALRNTSGGVIRINSPQKPAVKDRDDWMQELHEKRKTLLGSECGENDSLDDILDIQTKESTTHIFVRRSSIPIITDDSHLRQRSEDRNYKVYLYSRICEVLNKRQSCICVNHGKFQKSFHLGDTMSYESMTEEHKFLTGDNLAKLISEKLSDNVIAFANTKGGTIYFGIEDNHASIKGQKINDEKEQDDIHCSIVECVKRKFWVSSSGEKDVPIEGSHYHIKFFPVEGADDTTYVIAVHICAFPGTAVFKKEPECSVLDEKNKVVNLGFKEWLSKHKENKGDEKKLKRQDFGGTVCYTVQETIEDIYSDLIEFEASPGGRLKIWPNLAVDLIHNSLQMFFNCVNKMLEEKEWKGIAFFERYLGVNLGLENTKPKEVICDILVCSPYFPLLLVSLTEGEAASECQKYNRKLATTFKRILAQEGGCVEKFYVKPITLACSEVNDECIQEMISHEPDYPDTYKMSQEKYKAIVKALVPVLARVNSSFEGSIGEQLFHLLTKKQYRILFENLESPKLMISGPPGSGKTLLALERIHRLRIQKEPHKLSSKEVLFVCLDKVLEAQVRNMTVVVDGKPEQLCLVYDYYGFIYCLGSTSEPKQLSHVKHILIDECQNFKENPNLRAISFNWWERFCKSYFESNPSLWIFYDMHQQIIVEPCVLESLPDGFSFRPLDTVIRTTRKIHKFICDRFIKDDQPIHLGHDFEGEDVDVLVPKRPSEFKVKREVHLVYMLISILKGMVKNGVHPGTIGVLFTDGRQKNRYRRLFYKHTKNCLVKDGSAISQPDHDSIAFETVRVFSGYDKDYIIGFWPREVAKPGSQNDNGLMVSLCSRAKLKLILILEDEDVARSLGLADCMKETDIRWDNDAVIDFKF